jgi:hypothetical protein
MKNPKGVLILACAVLSGALMGASATIFYYEKHVQGLMAERPPRDHSPQSKADRLAAVLGLNPEEKARALEIMERQEPEIKASFAQAKVRLDQFLDGLAAQLSPALRPEQAARLADFVKEMKSRPRPPLGPPPGPSPHGPGAGPGPGMVPEQQPGHAPGPPPGPGPGPRPETP